jgi:hypothetical protein
MSKAPEPKSTGKIARDFLASVPAACLFPIKAAHKAPPCFDDNLNLASNDPKRIAQWQANYRGCNWGLATRRSSLIVMDVDTKPGKVGASTLFDLELKHDNLPRTLTVESPSGGKHFYFVASPEMLKRKSAAFGKDIDAPNYVLIPGCVLDGNGGKNDNIAGEYRIIDDAPIAPAPAWFLDYLDATEAQRVEQIPVVEQDTDAIRARCIDYLKNDAPIAIEGKNGDAITLQVAGVLKDMGVSQEMAVELMAEFWNSRCDPPWQIGEGPDADRLDVKVKNAFRYLTQNAPGADTAEADFGDSSVTDAEIAVHTTWWKARARAEANGELPSRNERRLMRKKKERQS